MINLSVNLADMRATTATSAAGSRSQAIDSQSFESELSQALSDALTKMGIDPSSVNVTVSDTSSQSTVTSQNPATAPTAKPTSWLSSPTPSVSADDTYWAAQPAVVQQLRNIGNESQRASLASQLAHQGYTIDFPIMVEGWDPQLTTQIRKAAGFTWVPSALQSPIPVAPGVTFPGLPSYDPANPPPGSIV